MTRTIEPESVIGVLPVGGDRSATLETKATVRVRELDGIRGFAILLVLAFHYIGEAKGAAPGSNLAYVQALLGLGWTGVDLFFVLSGFLIGGILLDVKRSRHYFYTFYRRRVHRIMPIFYVSTAFFGILSVTGFARLFPPILFEHAIPVWAYVLFAQNFWMASAGDFGPHWLGVTWSLAIEEQFYLILPPLVRFLGRRNLLVVIATGVLIAPLTRILVGGIYLQSGVAPYVLMPCRFDALGMGVLAAILVRGRLWSQLIHQHVYALYLAAAVLLGVMAILLVRYRSFDSSDMVTWGYSVVALFYVSLLMLATATHDGWTARLARMDFLEWLGRHSYCIYLIHQPVNFSLHFWIRHAETSISTLGAVVVTIVSLIVTMGIARLSWTYFEKPLVIRGHRFAY